MNLIRVIFTNPLISLGLILFISAFSLAAAFIAEGLYKIEPCILCIYQRYPFAIACALCLIGLGLYKRFSVKVIFALCALTFLANTGIAFYHTGIQEEWWVSAVDGCMIPSFEKNTNQSFLENILSAPTSRCSDVSWRDPFIGLTFANYNIILSFGLMVFCGLAAALTKKRQEP